MTAHITCKQKTQTKLHKRRSPRADARHGCARNGRHGWHGHDDTGPPAHAAHDAATVPVIRWGTTAPTTAADNNAADTAHTTTPPAAAAIAAAASATTAAAAATAASAPSPPPTTPSSSVLAPAAIRNASTAAAATTTTTATHADAIARRRRPARATLGVASIAGPDSWGAHHPATDASVCTAARTTIRR